MIRDVKHSDLENRAIEGLYEHTKFKATAYQVFLLAVAGELLREHDPREMVRGRSFHAS